MWSANFMSESLFTQHIMLWIVNDFVHKITSFCRTANHCNTLLFLVTPFIPLLRNVCLPMKYWACVCVGGNVAQVLQSWMVYACAWVYICCCRIVRNVKCVITHLLTRLSFNKILCYDSFVNNTLSLSLSLSPCLSSFLLPFSAT